MTTQTFDPHGSLLLPDMLDQAKLHIVFSPLWDRVKGTPFENDIPVWMVEFAHLYLKRHTRPDTGRVSEGVVDAALRLAAAGGSLGKCSVCGQWCGGCLNCLCPSEARPAWEPLSMQELAQAMLASTTSADGGENVR